MSTLSAIIDMRSERFYHCHVWSHEVFVANAIFGSILCKTE